LITDPPAPLPFFIRFLFLFIFQIRQFQGKQAIIFFFSIFFINGKPLKKTKKNSKTNKTAWNEAIIFFFLFLFFSSMANH